MQKNVIRTISLVLSICLMLTGIIFIQPVYAAETSSYLGEINIPVPADGEYYNYCPSILQTDTATRYVYFCANRLPGTSGSYSNVDDYIYFSKGTLSNGSWTWTGRQLALSPTGNATGPYPANWDGRHVCDPDVIGGKFNYNGENYDYALFYLGYYEKNGQDTSKGNEIGVAFSKSPEGPWVKYSENPVVNFPGNDFWGVGQPSVINVKSDASTGELILFYTRSDSYSTRAVYRELDFTDMSAPYIGNENDMPVNGLTSKTGSVDVFNNFDIAVDPNTGKLYGVRDRWPQPAEAPDKIADSLQVFTADYGILYHPANKWSVVENIGEAQTGQKRNHNAGIVTDKAGRLVNPGSASVFFTSGELGSQNTSLWTYRIHEYKSVYNGTVVPQPVPADTIDYTQGRNDTTGISHNFGDPISFSLVTNGVKKYIRYQITGEASNPVGIGNVIIDIPNEKRDWTSALGISIDVKNTESIAVPVRVMFSEAPQNNSTELWMTKAGATAALVSQTGNRSGVAINYDIVEIPAGFEGRLEIPFTSFKASSLAGINGDNVIQLQDIRKIYYEFDSVNFKSKSLHIADAALLKGVIVVPPVAPSPTVTYGGGSSAEPIPPAAVLPEDDLGTIANGTYSPSIRFNYGDAISFKDEDIEGVKYTKFDVTGAGSNPVGIGNVKINLPANRTNWAGGTGISVNVYNPDKSSSMPLRVMFQEASQELWLPKTGAKAVLVYDQEPVVTSDTIKAGAGIGYLTVPPMNKPFTALAAGSTNARREAVEIKYDIIDIPAGFKGHIEIPFDSFKASTLSGINGDGKLQKEDIRSIYYEFDTVNFKGKSLYISQNKLLRGDIVVPDGNPNKGSDANKADQTISAISTDLKAITFNYGDKIKFEYAKQGNRNYIKYNIIGSASSPVGIGNVKLTMSAENSIWTGGTGLAVYAVNPSKNSTLPVRIMFQESTGEMWLPKTGATAILQYSNGKKETVKINYDIIDLPAGFEGRIIIPFTSFKASTITGISGNGKLELSNISSLYYEFDTVNFKGKSLLLGDATLLRSKIDSSASQNDAANKNVKIKSTVNAAGDKKLVSFGKINAATLKDVTNVWKDGGKLSLTLQKSNMNVSIGATGKSADVGVIEISGLDGKWSGYKGISVGVENNSKDLVPIRFHFAEAKGTQERWITASAKQAVLTSSNGKKTVVPINYNAIDIPAGFKGVISIPFSNFEVISWHKTGDKKLDLSDISTVYIEFDCKLSKGKNVGVSEITLLKNNVAIANTGKTGSGQKTIINSSINAAGDKKLISFGKLSSGTFDNITNVWKDGGKLSLSQKNGAMNVKIGAPGNSAAVGVIEITGVDSKWDGYKGLSVNVTNNSNALVPIRFHFAEAKGTQERWITASGKQALLVSTSGKKTVVPINYNAIDIPVGFKGVISVPFSNFEVISWHKTGDKKLDLSNISTVYIEFDCKLSKGKNVNIGDISLLKKDLNIKNIKLSPGIVADFSAGDISQFVSVYDKGGNVKVSADSIGAEKAMKVQIGSANQKTGDKYSVVNIFGFNTNWKGYNGVKADFKNTDNNDILIEIAFEEKNGERWQTYSGSRVILKHKNGKQQITACFPVLRIPAGFDGQIIIPFENFKPTFWSKDDGKLDLSNITAMFLIGDCDVNNGRTYLIGNIELYKGKVKIDSILKNTVTKWKE